MYTHLPLSKRLRVNTHHVTEGVAKEDGMTIEQSPVSTPMTGLRENTQVTDHHHTLEGLTSEP